MDISTVRELNMRVEQEAHFLQALLSEVNKVMVGQEALVERLLIALLADGHILLEGVPGLAKTLLVKTAAEAIQADPFMTMVEDWEVEASEGGTRLSKTWRNMVMHKMKWLPMGLLIRRTAKAEHQKLVDGWNKAAA